MGTNIADAGRIIGAAAAKGVTEAAYAKQLAQILEKVDKGINEQATAGRRSASIDLGNLSRLPPDVAQNMRAAVLKELKDNGYTQVSLRDAETDLRIGTNGKPLTDKDQGKVSNWLTKEKATLLEMASMQGGSSGEYVSVSW